MTKRDEVSEIDHWRGRPGSLRTLRPRYLDLKSKGELEIAVDGDNRRFKQYGIVLVNPVKHAHIKRDLRQQFIDWVFSAEGQNAIKSYTLNGQRLILPMLRPQAEASGPHEARPR